MNALEEIHISEFGALHSEQIKQQALEALEHGKILYFPNLSFSLNQQETSFLSPQIVDSTSKSVSYDIRNDRVKGAQPSFLADEALKAMMRRFAIQANDFIIGLFPQYCGSLIQARTSFRPVEVLGRTSSYRKDDTRLHVDAFPSSPVKGRRILRLFSNVNPEGKPRVWRTGEPFSKVAERFIPQLRAPLPGASKILKFLGITKDYRTLYDHYMLKMHDKMKKDLCYQKSISYQEVPFPPGSTWIVYSDQVSHAVISGQHLFEQTFHLPSKSMRYPEMTPLSILETLLQRKLV